jgi:uncharacterized protein (DUF885 family)
MTRYATPLTPILAVVCLLAASAAHGQVGQPVDTAVLPVERATAAVGPVVPDLGELAATPTSVLAPVVERLLTDGAALMRRHDAPWSPARRERLRSFYSEWRDGLKEVDFDALDVEARIDWVLLDAEFHHRLHELDQQDEWYREMLPLVPFAEDIIGLHEARRRIEPVDARRAADLLSGLPHRIGEARATIEAAQAGGARGGGPVSTGRGAAGAAGPPSRIEGQRAADATAALHTTLGTWYDHYAGYDPLFTWWVAEPYERAREALDGYVRFLREQVVGERPGEEPPIVGEPIGADGMAADLRREMIPYTPAELIAIAERELAWGEEEMRRASRELGFGDDWHAALEHVKQQHVPPGDQPALVLELHRQSVDFLREHDLVTIPPLAEEVWRMEMLSPEMQRIAPFFLGGEVVRVAFPTDGMEHEDKLMSIRGNNEHFSRAVVHHELIPGHHLQGFMAARHNPHRRAFSTPFWHEGNALYWEMRLWDLGFPRGPEDRIGMLFWRNHRAARIIFSLSFHLERMTPEEAVEFLVDRVGHERANAEAEVRRSFGGTYPPLYQAAYMLGGLQFMALHRELVESGRMTEREFHDAILEGGRMPVEMVRARLTGQLLDRDYRAAWRFADR